MILSVSQALECLSSSTSSNTTLMFSTTTEVDVLRTVDHLNQAKAEPMDNERCAIKTETGIPGTANEEGTNSSSIQERVIMPRR